MLGNPSNDDRVDAAREESERLAGQYESELAERWAKAKPGLPLQQSLRTLETSMTEEQEEADARIH